jgi:hypothetical protein
MSDAPRMTPEEAEARFAALVAEHRGKKATKTAGPRVSRTPVHGGVVVALVFLFGLVVGTIGHARPVLAAIIGVPLVLIVRASWLRWSRDGGDD